MSMGKVKASRSGVVSKILFRGKRLDNGSRETGSLVVVREGVLGEQVSIADKMTGYLTPVDPETVGQYSGLTDRNGKQVFEGDIVEYEDAVADFEGFHDDVFANRGTVTLTPWGGVAFTNRQTVEMDDLYDSETSIDAEVVGSIYDGPEMLEGGPHGK